MTDDDKPPSYDNAGYAPPFTTPPQNPQFQASGVPPQQPYAGPPPNGAPYYPPQQQAGYNPGNVNVTDPAGAYPPPPTQYVQQPQVIIVNRCVQPAAVSMAGAIALSCVTFWIFGWLFGGIAFVLAIAGQSAATAGDAGGAIRMRNASYGVSIAGIVIFFVAIAVIVGVSVTSAKTTSSYSSYNSYIPYTGYSPYCYYNYYYSSYRCV